MNWFKEFIRTMISPFVPEEIRVEDGTWKVRFFDWLYGEPVRVEDEAGRVYPLDYDFSQDPWNKSQGIDNE